MITDGIEMFGEKELLLKVVDLKNDFYEIVKHFEMELEMELFAENN